MKYMYMNKGVALDTAGDIRKPCFITFTPPVILPIHPQLIKDYTGGVFAA